ncbi:putative disease resistance RPP13-like protein 1 [Corylus avellana]|uniref:putative disease resistance RPP13-like protein 1 n=1 Tax=Corylus avellana TaxID=13451 RepID=UPI002869F701|nr:putative disease resistance RPP13-like protein 1 [Corylus avellana]
MTELPESIGKIKHLRYLNLSSTTIKMLPDFLCKLCNLQILDLSCCEDLALLPRDMWKLINLRHLDISETAIKEMPMQLSRLKCLQTLTKFIISKHSGACIEELGKLENFRVKLSILELQNVLSPTDSLKACLKDRKHLELVLEWNDFGTNISECHRSVLDNLRPHSNLKSLTINYGAESLPDWVGHHSYSNIVSIHLKNCKLCPNLPPLGVLPSLQHLSIIGFEGVVKVVREFYGNNSSTIKPFGALKVLRFQRMLHWEDWSSFGAENKGRAFSQLEELYIIDCPKLKGVLPVDLPSAVKLEIRECPLLVASLPKAHVVRKLQLSNGNEVLLKELPTKLQELIIGRFGALESFPMGMLASTNCLQVLEIWDFSEQHGCDLVTLNIYISDCPNFIVDCPRVESFPGGGLPSHVVDINIFRCDKLLAGRVGWGLQKLPSVRDLRIGSKYEDVVSFPEPGLLPSSLTSLCIEFPNMKSWDNKGLQHLTSLQHLSVWDCPKLNYMPEEGLLTSLSVIEIIRCPLLRKQWQSKKQKERRKIPNVEHIVIDREEYIG